MQGWLPILIMIGMGAGFAVVNIGLGATRVRTGRGWIVLRDPNGMEYCCTGQDPVTGGVPPA